MSFKGKMYAIVLVLIIVALAIGGVGLLAVGDIKAALDKETGYAFQVSQAKEVQSNIQDALIAVREIVIAPSAEQMTGEKEKLNKTICI